MKCERVNTIDEVSFVMIGSGGINTFGPGC
jgi:hypothetical protein